MSLTDRNDPFLRNRGGGTGPEVVIRTLKDGSYEWGCEDCGERRPEWAHREAGEISVKGVPEQALPEGWRRGAPGAKPNANGSTAPTRSPGSSASG